MVVGSWGCCANAVAAKEYSNTVLSRNVLKTAVACFKGAPSLLGNPSLQSGVNRMISNAPEPRHLRGRSRNSRQSCEPSHGAYPLPPEWHDTRSHVRRARAR